MIKLMPFFLVSFFAFRQLNAQDKLMPDEKKFGFRLGANYSSISFKGGYQVTTDPVETGWKAGIAFGFFLQVHLSKNLVLQPEYLYSEMGGKNKKIRREVTG